MDLARAGRGLHDRFGLGVQLGAAHVDFPFRAGERDAASFALVPAVVELGAVGVHEGELLVLLAVRRVDFSRPAVVHVQRPLHDVEVVRAPVGHAAAGVVAEAAPPKRVDLGVVRPPRCRADPHVPVEPFGHRLGRQVAVAGRPAHTHVRGEQLADASVAHQLTGETETAGVP